MSEEAFVWFMLLVWSVWLPPSAETGGQFRWRYNYVVNICIVYMITHGVHDDDTSTDTTRQQHVQQQSGTDSQQSSPPSSSLPTASSPPSSSSSQLITTPLLMIFSICWITWKRRIRVMAFCRTKFLLPFALTLLSIYLVNNTFHHNLWSDTTDAGSIAGNKLTRKNSVAEIRRERLERFRARQQSLHVTVERYLGGIAVPQSAGDGAPTTNMPLNDKVIREGAGMGDLQEDTSDLSHPGDDVSTEGGARRGPVAPEDSLKMVVDLGEAVSEETPAHESPDGPAPPCDDLLSNIWRAIRGDSVDADEGQDLPHGTLDESLQDSPDIRAHGPDLLLPGKVTEPVAERQRRYSNFDVPHPLLHQHPLPVQNSQDNSKGIELLGNKVSRFAVIGEDIMVNRSKIRRGSNNTEGIFRMDKQDDGVQALLGEITSGTFDVNYPNQSVTSGRFGGTGLGTASDQPGPGLRMREDLGRSLFDCLTSQPIRQVEPYLKTPFTVNQSPGHIESKDSRIDGLYEQALKDGAAYAEGQQGPELVSDVNNISNAHSILDRAIDLVKTRLSKSRILLLHIPCGDVQDLYKQFGARKDIKYTGIDVVPDIVVYNREIYSNWTFFLHDIVESPLPTPYDLILFRMSLQRHSHSDSMKFISHLSGSGSRFLLATNYPHAYENVELSPTSGERRRVQNLQLPPYALEPPLCQCADHQDAYLGLWTLPLSRVATCHDMADVKKHQIISTRGFHETLYHCA